VLRYPVFWPVLRGVPLLRDNGTVYAARACLQQWRYSRRRRQTGRRDGRLGRVERGVRVTGRMVLYFVMLPAAARPGDGEFLPDAGNAAADGLALLARLWRRWQWWPGVSSVGCWLMNTGGGAAGTALIDLHVRMLVILTFRSASNASRHATVGGLFIGETSTARSERQRWPGRDLPDQPIRPNGWSQRGAAHGAADVLATGCEPLPAAIARQASRRKILPPVRRRQADIDAVAGFAAAHVAVVEAQAARRTIVLFRHGAAFDDAFGVTLQRFEHPAGRIVGGPDLCICRTV